MSVTSSTPQYAVIVISFPITQLTLSNIQIHEKYDFSFLRGQSMGLNPEHLLIWKNFSPIAQTIDD